MADVPDAPRARTRFPAAPEDVFRAAIETVRSMPGWEVITARPESGEIHARSRGRLFTPTMDHHLRLQGASDGTDLELESTTSRNGTNAVDEKSVNMFHALLQDRLKRGYFGPLQP